MGTIKLEIDIPEFEKELNINVTIRRDGEVLYSTSSPSMGSTGQEMENGKCQQKKIVEGPKAWPTQSPGNGNPSPTIVNPKKPSTGFGGNMMGLEI